MKKTEQPERIARTELFPFIWDNKDLISKDEYVISHIKRIKQTIDNHETLTPYDINKIDEYYEKVISKKYKVEGVKTTHDFRKKLRY